MRHKCSWRGADAVATRQTRKQRGDVDVGDSGGAWVPRVNNASRGVHWVAGSTASSTVHARRPEMDDGGRRRGQSSGANLALGEMVL